MSDEKSIRERVAKNEEDIKKIAKALKRVAIEIESEWGEEIVPPGTEIGDEKFE